MRFTVVVRFALSALLVSFPLAAAAESDYSAEIAAGRNLTPDAVQELVRGLAANPDNIPIRAQVIGYYATHGVKPEERVPKLQQLEWLIEHHPDSRLVRNPITILNGFDLAGGNIAELQKVRGAWSQQSFMHPNDARIAEGAARMLELVDPKSALAYYQRLRSMEPSDPEWPFRIALQYARLIVDGTGKTDKAVQAELEKDTDVAVVGLTGQDVYFTARFYESSRAAVPIGEALLKRAQSLDPENPKWSQILEDPPPANINDAMMKVALSLRAEDLWPGGVVPAMKVPAGAIRVEAKEEAARLVRVVPIAFNQTAVNAHIDGPVRLTALIGTDGQVRQIHILSGPGVLIRNMVDAVRQWTFKPMVVNGKPVEVVTDLEIKMNTTTGAQLGDSFLIPGPRRPPVLFAAPPPPPPAPAARGFAEGKVLQNVGPFQGIERPTLLKKVEPMYPPLARQAHVTGTVTFDVTVGKDGSVQSLKLVDGHPLFVSAADEAVRQWIFKPAKKNGVPVALVTRVLVNFTLSNDSAAAPSAPAAATTPAVLFEDAMVQSLRQNLGNWSLADAKAALGDARIESPGAYQFKSTSPNFSAVELRFLPLTGKLTEIKVTPAQHVPWTNELTAVQKAFPGIAFTTDSLGAETVYSFRNNGSSYRVGTDGTITSMRIE